MTNKGFSLASTVAVTNPNVIEPTYLNVGLDCGNLHNRVVSDSFAEMQQSYVLVLDEGDGLSCFECVKDVSASKRWTSKRFLTGDAALAIDGVSGDRTMDANENKYQLALPLLVSSLWSKIDEVGTVIRLGVTVPKPATFEPGMLEHLNGSGFVFRHKGVTKRFDIEVIKVYTEGQGVIKRQANISKGIFLLDIGNDTIIISEFQGYSLKTSFPLESSGVRALVQNLIASDELSTAVDRTADLNDVVAMFEASKGSTFVLYDHDVSETVNRHSQEWITQCVKSAKRNMKNAFDNSPTKIATGGGCKIDVVREYLVKQGFAIAGDPLWDNAAGVYQFVCGKFGDKAEIKLPSDITAKPKGQRKAKPKAQETDQASIETKAVEVA